MKRQRACSDTPATQPRHGRPQAVTRPGHGHDMAPVHATTQRNTAGLGVVHSQCARRLSHGCVHTVHLTQS